MTAIPLQENEFEDIISEFQPRLFAFIYSLTKDQVQAQDIMQNTNIVLWNKRDQFQLGSNFKAWAFQVAYYEVKHAKKVQIRSKENLRLDETILESLQAETYELDNQYELRRSKLKECFQKLSEEQKYMIVDRYYANESVQSMADHRRISPNTMAKQLSRIRKVLMHCIDKKTKSENKKQVGL